MKKTLLLALLSVFVFSCSTESAKKLEDQDNVNLLSQIKNNSVQKAKWTIMVYMSGDNDLEEYIVKDLENELGLIGSAKDVQIIALADRNPKFDKSRGNWTTAKLFHVNKGLIAESKNALADKIWILLK